MSCMDIVYKLQISNTTREPLQEFLGGVAALGGVFKIIYMLLQHLLDMISSAPRYLAEILLDVTL